MFDDSSTKGIAANVSGTVTLLGIPGVSLSGSVALEVNTTNQAINVPLTARTAPPASCSSIPAST